MTQESFPFAGRVVKIELLKSLHYFIDHHNGIALWNRTAVKSSVGSRRCNMADNRLGFEMQQLLQMVAILKLRDSIHGVPGSRQLKMRNESVDATLLLR